MYNEDGYVVDAASQGFFKQQLTTVMAKTYDIVYADLKAKTAFPVKATARPFDKYLIYRQFDKVGLAKIIANYASDFPSVHIKGKEFTSNLRDIGASYGYSIKDLQASQANQLPLVSDEATAARRANDELADKITWFGDAENGLQGLFDNPNIPTITVPADGTGSTTEWIYKTSTQILRDLNDLVNSIVELTKEIEIPNTLMMPTSQYNLINDKKLDSVSNTTVLQYFKSTNSYVTDVVSVPILKGAGAGASDVMVAYNKNPEKMWMEIPLDFTQETPQQIALRFTVFCHSTCGGLIVPAPLSAAIANGI